MRELKPRNVSMGSLATNWQQTPSAAKPCVPGLSPPTVCSHLLGFQSCPFIASSKCSENLELPQLIIDDKITDTTFWKKPCVSFKNYLEFFSEYHFAIHKTILFSSSKGTYCETKNVMVGNHRNRLLALHPNSFIESPRACSPCHS